MRKPFQGTWNIIRFNWQFYVSAIVAVIILFFLRNNPNASVSTASTALIILIFISTLFSLLVSCYIYDFSNLYTLNWLDKIKFSNDAKIVNINAGFDETSDLLKNKFHNSELLVFDFYDPSKHTEVSIKRARKAYPPFPNTIPINTSHVPLQNNAADTIFIIFSAHEIRDEAERIAFFKELHRALTSSGQIIVTEHLRDPLNFLAYNIGFLHFHSKAKWMKTFRDSALQIAAEIKITPFITTFILEKNGTAT